MDWKNYLIAVTLIGIVILAVAFAFVNGELTNLRSNLSTLQADATTLEMDINDMNITLYQLQLKILELESRTSKKNYVSIPSSAFSPATSTQTYEKGAGYLKGSGVFRAAVQLPDKVNVTKMSVLVVDISTTGYVYVYLNAHNLTGGVYSGMAEVRTSAAGAPGQVWLIDDTIYCAIIDNKNCAYVITLNLSEDSYSLYIMGIILEYDYTS